MPNQPHDIELSSLGSVSMASSNEEKVGLMSWKMQVVEGLVSRLPK